MTRQLLSIFEADGQHKATLRERLKGQDEILGKLLGESGKTTESIKSLERRFESLPWPGRRGP